MSLKVLSVSAPVVPTVTVTKPHVFEADSFPLVEVVKDNVKMCILFSILTGFKVDGASIPWAFRWFLPQWDSENYFYNIGSTIHDGLYANKGFGIFSREECDDILRGIWRESGISRFKAGVADKAVEWFAGGEKHWGNDSYGVKQLFKMDIL